jgi:hypothetical protein
MTNHYDDVTQWRDQFHMARRFHLCLHRTSFKYRVYCVKRNATTIS